MVNMMPGAFASPHQQMRIRVQAPEAHAHAMGHDTPPGEVEIERKLAGLRAARNMPPGEAAQMAMEEGQLRFELERSKRKRSGR